VACVTSGFVAPGVQARSGKPLRLTHEFGGRIALACGRTIAAAVVGVGVGCEGIGDAVAAAPPQLTAKTATTIRHAARNRALRPTTIPTLPADETTGTQAELGMRYRTRLQSQRWPVITRNVPRLAGCPEWRSRNPSPTHEEPRPRPWDGAPFYVLTGVTFSRKCRAAASTASADVVSISGCTPTPLYISPLGPVTC